MGKLATFRLKYLAQKCFRETVEVPEVLLVILSVKYISFKRF